MISIEQLKKLLTYDSPTGKLKWRTSRSNQIEAGTQAGYIHRSGRRCIEISGKEYKAAIIAWAIYYGEWPCSIVDHADRDKLNDRIANLRLATKQQNCTNTKMYSNNTSGFRGVARAPGGKFKAYIRVNKRVKHLGVFNSPQEASEAYVKEAGKVYGSFIGEIK